MSDPFGDRPFPRTALVGAALLISLALAATAAGRVTGLGLTRMPATALVESRDFRFEDRTDGSVAVYAIPGAKAVTVLAPGTNSFVRGALRGLARERKRQDIGNQPPFRLSRWADGRLTLEDPTTSRSVDLGAFGPTNARAFAQLLIAADATP